DFDDPKEETILSNKNKIAS
ncbi:MAG: hypothetical protein EZS28_048735, partial [Streblomastix strix]